MREEPEGPGALIYSVTYLAMSARPGYPRPHAPVGAALALIRADAPPPWYFLSLYDAVGAAHEWADWHRLPRADLVAFLSHPRVELYTLLRHGWPAGFFMLDTREAGVCDLAYFGLVPEALGQGLGKWLLRTAVHMGWDRDGVTRMTVNTNTLDHPAALPLYQKCGFEVEAREEGLSRRPRRPAGPI